MENPQSIAGNIFIYCAATFRHYIQGEDLPICMMELAKGEQKESTKMYKG